jgi:3-oxoadipate enol-lactonase
MTDMGADIHAVIQHLGLEKPDIVGLSMDGAVAMHHAIDFPGDLARLVTIGAPVGPIEAVRATRAQDYEFIMSNPIGVIARNRMERAFTGSRDSRFKEWVIAMIASMQIDSYRSQAAAGASMNLFERLHLISAPHEIINGEAETVVIPAVAHFIHAHSPHSRLHVIPDASHFWSLEEANAFNTLLAGLLDR